MLGGDSGFNELVGSRKPHLKGRESKPSGESEDKSLGQVKPCFSSHWDR